MNPKYKVFRFNSYLCPSQKEMLDKLSQETHRSRSDIVREALHRLLRDRGYDDGLLYDKKDMEKEGMRSLEHMKQSK